MNPISRRILGFGVISALASMAFPAFASPTPTAKCRFLGQKTTFKGKLYTCIKGKSKGKSKGQSIKLSSRTSAYLDARKIQDVNFNGTMPVGGGSTTITIGGTSTIIIAYANFNFTETSGGQSETEGDWDNATLQVSGSPGSTHSISNYWRTTNSGNSQNFTLKAVSIFTKKDFNVPNNRYILLL